MPPLPRYIGTSHAMPPPVDATRFVRHTLTEIARELGVSLTTVSRALSGTGRIAPETRRKILRRAEELQGAAAPPAAPLMKRMLGLFTPWYAVSFGMHTSIATAAQDAVRAVCEPKGYGLVVSSFGNPDRPIMGDELLRSAALAGVILHRTRDEAAIAAEITRRGLQYVFVYRNLEGCGLNYVGVDFAEVVRMAADHCLELGMREIALICGDISYPSQRGYRDAFLEVQRNRKLPHEPGWLKDVAISEENGYRAARQMLARRPPRAIICGSDRLAFGVLRALHDAGRHVPREVAVVTIDGTVQSAFTRPSLTAVQIPWNEMFAVAARLLLNIIESHAPLCAIGAKLRCELVVRESTAGSAGSAAIA